MGLEDGKGEGADKAGGKIRSMVHPAEGEKKSLIRNFQITQKSQPLCFVIFPKLQPFIELTGGNRETFTQLLYGIQMQKVFCKDTQYEEETVGTVGNDDIWKDGMGRPTTVTNTTKDSDFMANILSTDEIDEIPLVIAMNPQFSSGFTDWAGLEFRSYKRHELVKERF